MRLALDTHAYTAFMRKEARAFHLVRTAERIFMPVPVVGELRYGFANGKRSSANEAALTRFLDSPRVEILPCDEQTTHFFATLRLQLKRQGTPIPMNDVWIAALVQQHGLILFSDDTDFDRLGQIPRA